MKPIINKNFTMLLFGSTLSQFGDRLHQVAIFWYSYELTGSASLLALVATATALPYLLFGFAGGAVVDRYDKRKFMIFADTVRALLVSIMFVLGVLNQLNITMIVIFSFLLAVFSQFFEPAEQASITAIVDEEHLLKANASLSSWQQLARLIAPVIAGFLMLHITPMALLLVDAISFLVSAAMVYHMCYASRAYETVKAPPWSQQISDAYHYVRKASLLLLIIVIFGIINFLYYGASIVIPTLLSREVLGSGSYGYGMMLSAYSLGMLAAAFAIERKGKHVTPFVAYGMTALLGGISLLLVGAAVHLSMALVGFFLAGLFFNVIVICSVTYVQKEVPAVLQGAVFGLFGTIAMGSTPLSTALTSLVSLYWDARTITYAVGAFIAVAGLLALFHPSLRKTDSRKEEPLTPM